jgi:hypothetical protein
MKNQILLCATIFIISGCWFVGASEVYAALASILIGSLSVLLLTCGIPLGLPSCPWSHSEVRNWSIGVYAFALIASIVIMVDNFHVVATLIMIVTAMISLRQFIHLTNEVLREKKWLF